MTEQEKIIDDGSLACLGITKNDRDKRFTCKEELRGYFEKIREALGALRLHVKDNWQIFPVEARGIDFLGFVFRHGYIRLRKRIKHNLFRTLAHLRKVCSTPKEIRLGAASYIGWLKFTDSRNLTNKLNTFCYAKIF